MDRSEIAIIVPALNEAKTIGRVVEMASKYGKVLVVDDGSSDATADTAQSAGAIVIKHGINKGYDQALNSGFHCAAQNNFKYAITLDADGQNDTGAIQSFIDGFDSASVVIGIRDHKQRLAEHLTAYACNALYGISDPLCGMKGYEMVVFKHLGHFDCYGSLGTELALFAAKNSYPIKQIPVRTFARPDRSRMGKSYRVNVAILRALLVSFFKVHRLPKPVPV